jgi:hypothetical protein
MPGSPEETEMNEVRCRTTYGPRCLKIVKRLATGGFEKMEEDGGYEVVKVFTGPDAREEAIRYAEREFGAYDEIRLEPCGPPPS